MGKNEIDQLLEHYLLWEKGEEPAEELDGLLAEYLHGIKGAVGKERPREDTPARSRTIEELVMRFVVDGDNEVKETLAKQLRAHLTGPGWPAVSGEAAPDVPPAHDTGPAAPSAPARPDPALGSGPARPAAPARPAVPPPPTTGPPLPVVGSAEAQEFDRGSNPRTSQHVAVKEFEDRRAHETARHLPPDDDLEQKRSTTKHLPPDDDPDDEE